MNFQKMVTMAPFGGDLVHHLDPVIFKIFLSLYSKPILDVLGFGKCLFSLSAIAIQCNCKLFYFIVVVK